MSGMFQGWNHQSDILGKWVVQWKPKGLWSMYKRSYHSTNGVTYWPLPGISGHCSSCFQPLWHVLIMTILWWTTTAIEKGSLLWMIYPLPWWCSIVMLVYWRVCAIFSVANYLWISMIVTVQRGSLASSIVIFTCLHRNNLQWRPEVPVINGGFQKRGYPKMDGWFHGKSH